MGVEVKDKPHKHEYRPVRFKEQIGESHNNYEQRPRRTFIGVQCKGKGCKVVRVLDFE